MIGRLICATTLRLHDLTHRLDDKHRSCGLY